VPAEIIYKGCCVSGYFVITPVSGADSGSGLITGFLFLAVYSAFAQFKNV
jgi:hypothetical protein